MVALESRMREKEKAGYLSRDLRSPRGRVLPTSSQHSRVSEGEPLS